MNSKAFNEFQDFLAQITPTNEYSRIGYILKQEAYLELVTNWVNTDANEFTFCLDNEAQFFLILLILEASK